MIIFKHIQFSALTAVVISATTFPNVLLADQPENKNIIVATPVYTQPAPKAPKKMGKMLSKTFSTNVSKRKESLPLYRSNGELKNDLATRLTDPQRKISPIRTARLFKIQINEPES